MFLVFSFLWLVLFKHRLTRNRYFTHEYPSLAKFKLQTLLKDICETIHSSF